MLSNNSITSLKGFTTQPELKSLVLDNNAISNFESMPHFPKLERLEIKGNEVCNMSYFREVTGSLFTGGIFHKLNGEEVISEERVQSDRFRIGVSHSIREGYVPLNHISPNDVISEAKRFLRRLQVEKTMHTPLQLVKIDMYGDYIEGNPILFTPIFKITDPDLEIISKGMNRHTFTVKNSDAQSGRLCIEDWEPIELIRTGNGNHAIELLLPCGAYEYRYEFDGVASQNMEVTVEETMSNRGARSENALLLSVEWFITTAEGSFKHVKECREMQYFPTLDDAGRIIKTEMKCHRKGKLLFNVQDITDGTVEYAVPTCIAAEIIGNVAEGETVGAIVQYFGGHEGKSEYRWFDEHGHIISETAEYTISSKDIGTKLRFEYTPVNADGKSGEPYAVQTAVVQAGPPSIENLHVDLPIVESKPINVSYSYSGGVEGQSEIRWYRFSSDAQNIESSLVQVGNSHGYTPGLSDVNNYLRVECVPLSSQGVQGKIITFDIPLMVQPADPHINSLVFTPVPLCENEILTIEVDYTGGFEGQSKIEWFRVGSDSDIRMPIADASSKSYRIQTADIGYKIEARYMPIREDGAIGETKTVITDGVISAMSPRCESLEMVGTLMEGCSLHVTANYIGGIEGQSLYRFYRSTQDSFEFITESTDPELALTLQDVGKRIKVDYIPMRNDDVQGEISTIISTEHVCPGNPTLSNLKVVGEVFMEGHVLKGEAMYTGGHEKERLHRWIRVENGREYEIKDATEETYTLTLSDVYFKIRYGCKSIREDGLETEWIFSGMSDEIAPMIPVVLSGRVEGNITEGSLLTFQFEGNDKISEYHSMCNWYRVDNADDENCLTPVGASLQYQVLSDDVGYRLKVSFTPGRNDLPQIFGETFELHTASVSPAQPLALECKLEGESKQGSTLTARTRYFGGQEGSSDYKWYRVTSDGKEIHLADMSGHKSYRLTYKDEEHSIRLEYTPVRNDGVKGKTVEAISGMVPTVVPTISDLAVSGNYLEGEKLVCSGNYSGGAEGKSILQWFAVNEKTRERKLVCDQSQEYIIKVEDIGHLLVFAYTPVREDGMMGATVEVIGSVVQPNDPTINNLKIVGQPFISKLLSLQGDYSGGLEGESKIEWFSSSFKNGPFTLLNSGSQRNLLLTADENDNYIKVQYTPIRSDGKRGNPVETQPQVRIQMAPNMSSTLRNSIEGAKAEFEVKNGTTGAPCMLFINSKRYKVYENGRRMFKTQFRNNFNKVLVRVHRSDGTRFYISNIKNKSEMVLMATSAIDRDLIVMVLRSYQGMADNTTSMEILGSEFTNTWKRAKRATVSFDSIPTSQSSPREDSSTRRSASLPEGSIEEERIIRVLESLRKKAEN